jgi:hypothetical protein
MPAVAILSRYAWASPATLVGLVLGLAAWVGGGRVMADGRAPLTARWVDGVFELGGGRALHTLRRLPFARRFGAITFGHVVIGIDAHALDHSRAHERIHVAQYERWGVLFFPAYLGASAVQWLRGRDPYLDNPFERAAFDGAMRGAHDVE